MIRNANLVATQRMCPHAAIFHPRSMHGISLVEVLVSVVVIAIGLLGIAAMQSVALRGGQSSLESSQAVMQTTSIIESIRANRSNASTYNMTAMQCSSVGVGTTLVQNDIAAWIASLKSTIGTSADTTTCGHITGCPACVVTVQWDDQRASGGAARQVVTETRI